jgi:hypothetical protein
VSYGFLIAVFGGTMLIWMNRDAPFGYEFVQNALRLNPMAAALNAMQTNGFEPYNLVPSTWWITGGSCGVLLVVLHSQLIRLTRPD